MSVPLREKPSHKRPASRKTPPRKDASTEFLNPFDNTRLLRYYHEVFKWHGYLRFLGLPHLNDVPDVPIQRLYVEPRFSESRIPPAQDPGKWPKTTTILAAIEQRPRLVLLGDPGSGKSALISWIAWQLIRAEANPWTERLGRVVPIPMILRDLTLQRDITWPRLLDAFLVHAMAKPLGGRQFLDDLIDRGQAFFMLDGLDEVGNVDTRGRLRDAVLDGFRHTSGCRWLLTSRVVGYDDVPFHSRVIAARKLNLEADTPASPMIEGHALINVAHVGHLAPFADAQVDQFAANWYRQHDTIEPEHTTGKFLAALRRDRGTQELGRIPNLLTIMALVFRIEARLPYGRALLYNKIAEAYLESIDRFRGLREVHYPPEQKKRWLAWIGYQAQFRRSTDEGSEKQREVLLARGDIHDWLVDAMSSDGVHDAREADAFLSFLARRSGLLLPRGPEEFAFVHLSFQEYFAACHLADQVTSPDWILAASRSGDPTPKPTLGDLQAFADTETWQEVLLFLFELLAARPRWTDAFAEQLFGTDFNRLTIPYTERWRSGTPASELVASLSVDPHVHMSDTYHRAAWRRCWRLELDAQTLSTPTGEQIPVVSDPALAKRLLAAEPAMRSEVWDTLIELFSEQACKCLTLNACPIESEDLDRLAELRDLQVLRLDSTGVTDLTALVQLGELQELYVSYTGVTDLAPLSRLGRLQKLYISYTCVTDLSPLFQLSSLQVLSIVGTGVSDFACLAQFEHLQELSVGGAGVTSLASFPKLRNLSELNIHDTGVSDLAALAQLRNLKRLRISDAAAVDITPISTLTHLHEFSISGPGIIDIAPLTGLGSLKSLYIFSTGVSNLALLAQLGSLQRLILTGPSVTDLAPLAKLRRLSELYAIGTSVTDVAPLADLSSLEELVLDSTRVADIASLAALVNLKGLDVSGTGVTDLAPLAQLVNLKRLDVSGTGVTDLAPIAHLVSLQILNLRNCPASKRVPPELEQRKGLRIYR